MRRATAFTLVEILIVVVLLGVLAAVVVPSFSNASQSARCSMLLDNLRIMRTQVQVFKAQHNDVAPGYPGLDNTAAPTEEAFVDHMTMATTVSGDVAAPGTGGYPYGPYLREIPENPVNGRASVRVLADGDAFPAEAANTHGYVYQPATGILKADSTGTDEGGRAFFDY
ncbi:MAG: prepilin-type N-terminal cleavage/methylation domain-containing protein [Phycisphaerae bacterium]